MDRRTTLRIGESFLNIITECMQRQETAAILYDDNGITRAHGKIVEISIAQEPPTFRLDSGEKININAVVAINGIFSDNYNEC